MRPVEVVIAGIQKCGTTSLHQMLAQHPRIRTHATGQWPYFLHEDAYLPAYEAFMHQHFSGSEDHRLILVRDTSLSASARALERLAGIAPSTKIILMVRHPVERAYSAYTFAMSQQYDVEPTFEEGLSQQARFQDNISKYLVRNYIPLGLYYATMKRVEAYFPRAQILMFKSEDLRLNPQKTMSSIFDFLDLRPHLITTVETNLTRKSRFSFLQRLTKTDNFARSVFRRSLPLHTRHKILRTIGFITTSKERFPPMNSDTRDWLNGVFRSDLQNLKDEYGINYLENQCP